MHHRGAVVSVLHGIPPTRSSIYTCSTLGQRTVVLASRTCDREPPTHTHPVNPLPRRWLSTAMQMMQPEDASLVGQPPPHVWIDLVKHLCNQ